MHGLVHLPAFLLAATLVIVIPGPATALVAGRVIPAKLARALALVAAAGLGLAAWASHRPELIEVIEFIGGLFVAYVGLEILNTPPCGRAQQACAWGLLGCAAFILLA